MPKVKVDFVKEINKVDLILKFIDILDLSGPEFAELLTRLMEF